MIPEEAIIWLGDDIKEINRDLTNEEISSDYAEEGTKVYEIAISAIKEVQQYREIGTVEECREAMEKQIPRKPRDVEYDYSYFVCDNCGTAIYTSDEFDGHHYCLNCGQAIEWPDMNLEGMKDE